MLLFLVGGGEGVVFKLIGRKHDKVIALLLHFNLTLSKGRTGQLLLLILHNIFHFKQYNYALILYGYGSLFCHLCISQ